MISMNILPSKLLLNSLEISKFIYEFQFEKNYFLFAKNGRESYDCIVNVR